MIGWPGPFHEPAIPEVSAHHQRPFPSAALRHVGESCMSPSSDFCFSDRNSSSSDSGCAGQHPDGIQFTSIHYQRTSDSRNRQMKESLSTPAKVDGFPDLSSADLHPSKCPWPVAGRSFMHDGNVREVSISVSSHNRLRLNAVPRQRRPKGHEIHPLEGSPGVRKRFPDDLLEVENGLGQVSVAAYDHCDG